MGNTCSTLDRVVEMLINIWSEALNRRKILEGLEEDSGMTNMELKGRGCGCELGSSISE
jgi:hypothetical protein